MAGNQLPVLTLDIDEEKIQQLADIAEKFKAAFTIGPNGKPTLNAQNTIPGSNIPKSPQVGEPETEFDKFLKNLNKEGRGTLKTFGLINKTLGVTTRTLKGLFTNTLTWGTRLAALSVAGPFGYNLLARSVNNQFLGSQALGITTGQAQAASSVYGAHFSGTDNILQSLAAAQNDPSQPAYAGLLSLGLDPRDGVNENLPKLLEKVSGLLEQYKDSGVSQTILKARGLDFISVADANQMVANSASIPLLNQQYTERANRLDTQISPQVQRGYQDVHSNFSYNADQIGNTFLTTISRLNEPLKQLSDSITVSIERFLNEGNGKALFDTLGNGLENLARWLASSQFQDDLKTFADNVKSISNAIWQAIQWIAGTLPNINLTGSGTDKSEAHPALVEYGNKYLDGKLPHANPYTGKYTEIFTQEAALEKLQLPEAQKINPQVTPVQKTTAQETTVQKTTAQNTNEQKTPVLPFVGYPGIQPAAGGPTVQSIARPTNSQFLASKASFQPDARKTTVQQTKIQEAADKANIQLFVREVNDAVGLPKGLMSAVAQQESSWNPLAVNPKSGTAGLFQFTPATAKGYGLTGNEVFDPNKSTLAAAKYLTDNMRRYKGDIAKSLTQYNGGRIDKNGNLSIKKETVDYLLKILPQTQGAREQHPGIIRDLLAAQGNLKFAGKDTRTTITLDINQMPGSDISAQVKGIYTPR